MPAARKTAAPKKATRTRKVPAARAVTVAPAPVPTKAAKVEKPRKPKLVRDSFTIPKHEYAVIDALKKRASKASVPSKKSEVLRAGIMALASMDDAAFRAAMAGVPTLKTGRPKKG